MSVGTSITSSPRRAEEPAPRWRCAASRGGESALCSYAIERAEGMTVLTTRGVESEHGERLRRARRRTEARGQLERALATYERVGAEPWAERARSELRANGDRPRPIHSGAVAELTAQELQVALAVSHGATNREAATALFLSPKTVEAHLGRAHRKLGAHSRTELTRLLAEEQAPAEPVASA